MGTAQATVARGIVAGGAAAEVVADALGRVTRVDSLGTSSANARTAQVAWLVWLRRTARQKTSCRSSELRDAHTPDRVGKYMLGIVEWSPTGVECALGTARVSYFGRQWRHRLFRIVACGALSRVRVSGM